MVERSVNADLVTKSVAIPRSSSIPLVMDLGRYQIIRNTKGTITQLNVDGNPVTAQEYYKQGGKIIGPDMNGTYLKDYRGAQNAQPSPAPQPSIVSSIPTYTPNTNVWTPPVAETRPVTDTGKYMVDLYDSSRPVKWVADPSKAPRGYSSDNVNQTVGTFIASTSESYDTNGNLRGLYVNGKKVTPEQYTWLTGKTPSAPSQTKITEMQKLRSDKTGTPLEQSIAMQNMTTKNAVVPYEQKVANLYTENLVSDVNSRAPSLGFVPGFGGVSPTYDFTNQRWKLSDEGQKAFASAGITMQKDREDVTSFYKTLVNPGVIKDDSHNHPNYIFQGDVKSYYNQRLVDAAKKGEAIVRVPLFQFESKPAWGGGGGVTDVGSTPATAWNAYGAGTSKFNIAKWGGQGVWDTDKEQWVAVDMIASEIPESYYSFNTMTQKTPPWVTTPVQEAIKRTDTSVKNNPATFKQEQWYFARKQKQNKKSKSYTSSVKKKKTPVKRVQKMQTIKGFATIKTQPKSSSVKGMGIGNMFGSSVNMRGLVNVKPKTRATKKPTNSFKNFGKGLF
jgi:hypothetical protein